MRFLVIISLLVLGAGASAANAGDTPALPKKMEKRVTKKVCTENGAPTFTLIEKTDRLRGGIWRIDGCKTDPIHATWGLSQNSWFYYDDSALPKIARFDLGCEEIEIQLINDVTRGVVGCGTRARYVIVGATWVANTAKE